MPISCLTAPDALVGPATATWTIVNSIQTRYIGIMMTRNGLAAAAATSEYPFRLSASTAKKQPNVSRPNRRHGCRRTKAIIMPP
jgi:hypothetical protein